MRLRIAGLMLGLFATAAVAAPPADDAWIAAIEGGWAGQADRTPMGGMPFVMLFDRTDDGAFHSRTALNQETYIEMRFWQADDGRWMLTESAGLEGQGVQEYTMIPVATDDAARRWIVEERPGFMNIDIEVRDDTMLLDVEILGRPHASFEMQKMDDERVPEMRGALARQAQLSPEENSIHDVIKNAEAAPAADPIEAARAHAAEHPDDAQAQMDLARKLSHAIQTDPSAGPRYAYELLTALEKTVRLDPTLVDAYSYLVGYYLNAPAIAGGSPEKAKETATKLAQYDPATSKALLEQVARHGDGSQRAGGH